MVETISSRTPEGEPNHCPICGGLIAIEPSISSGDAPCPRCGALLWFIGGGGSPRLYAAEAVERVKERIYKALTDEGGKDMEQINEFLSLMDESRDSLDMAELVMALEGEFETRISDEDAQQIRTVADLIEWLLRRGW